MQKTTLGHAQFKDSYYDEDDYISGGKRYGDWITWNTYQYNINVAQDGVTPISPSGMTYTQFKNLVKNDVDAIPSNALTPQMWLKQPQDNYCLADIFIKLRLRLLCGEADQLSMNIKGNGKDGTSIIAYPDIGKWNAEYTTSMSGDYEYKENSHGEDLETRFRRSMQAWYGMYYIPSELTVVDLIKHPVQKHTVPTAG